MTFSKIKISSNKTGQNRFLFQVLGLGILLGFVLVVNLITFQSKHSHLLNSVSQVSEIEQTYDQVESSIKFAANIPMDSQITNIYAE